MKFLYVTFKGRSLSKADIVFLLSRLDSSFDVLTFNLYNYDYFRWKLSNYVRFHCPEDLHFFTNLY